MATLIKRVTSLTKSVKDLEQQLPPELTQVKTITEQTQRLFKTKELREFLPAALQIYNEVTLTSTVNDLERRVKTMQTKIEQAQTSGQLPKRHWPWGWLIGGVVLGGGVVWAVKK